MNKGLLEFGTRFLRFVLSIIFVQKPLGCFINF